MDDNCITFGMQRRLIKLPKAKLVRLAKKYSCNDQQTKNQIVEDLINVKSFTKIKAERILHGTKSH
jgi:hypothetical protein